MMLRPLISFHSLLLSLVLLTFADKLGAVTVDPPNSFQQCMPAVIGLSKAQGNVSIAVHEQGIRKAVITVRLPPNSSSWEWPAVNVSAGQNITISVTDRSAGRKTHSLLQSVVEAGNDTSCLPPIDAKSSSSNSNATRSDGSGPHSNGPQHRSGLSTTTVSIIAGVLGGLLLSLLLLILFMCWRRRRESLTDSSSLSGKDSITAHRIGVMGEVGAHHQVVTLFSEEGRPEGQAILGREGDAGWSYMNRIVPGLQLMPQTEDYPTLQSRNGRRGEGKKTKRYDQESKDGELPSYRRSEYERKMLPRYAADRQQLSKHSGPMKLTTRHDSSGSRLTLQPDLTAYLAASPRESNTQFCDSHDENAGEEEDVIVFRPVDAPSALAYHRNEADQASLYSTESQDRTEARQSPAAVLRSQQPVDYTSQHRRSRSEATMRRSHVAAMHHY